MKDDNDNTCAHEMCNCRVDDDADYCSDNCEKASDGDMSKTKCGCGHSACS